MKTVILSALMSALLGAAEIYTTFDVEAEHASELTLTATGVIEKMFVDVGDHVKAGEVLLSLDNEDLKLSVELARSDLELAELNHRRNNFV